MAVRGGRAAAGDISDRISQQLVVVSDHQADRVVQPRTERNWLRRWSSAKPQAEPTALRWQEMYGREVGGSFPEQVYSVTHPLADGFYYLVVPIKMIDNKVTGYGVSLMPSRPSKETPYRKHTMATNRRNSCQEQRNTAMP
jgi:hypothetical protein